MIEIFEPESYLFKSDKILEINKFNSCFRNGIVLNYKLLYFLLKGTYFEDKEIKKINFSFSEEERISYKSLIILLNKIKGEIKEYTIFITPHTFTKFYNELRGGVRDPKHFGNILRLFIDNFSYIKEEELKKEEIISKSFFCNRYCGLSETTLILLKEKLGEICIIDSSKTKILEHGGDNYLFVDFPTLVNVIKTYEEREKLL